MAFPFLTVFIVFVVFLAIRYRTIDKNQKKHIQDYWDRQATADRAPNKDLNTLPYLKFPNRTFPFGSVDDEEIAALEERIQELIHHPLLNLNGMDNAALRETYGSDNFDFMVNVSDEFDQLQMLLVDYAKALLEHDHTADAMQVLEVGVKIGTDVSSNYTLLGDCYKATGQLEKIPTLKEKLQQLHLLLEPSIVSYLDSLVEDQ